MASAQLKASTTGASENWIGVSNAPITYRVDGRQYMLVAVGDTLYSFVMY